MRRPLRVRWHPVRWLAVPVLAAAAAGQGLWVQVPVVSPPTPRVWPATTYDPATQRVCMFGGYSNGSFTDFPSGQLWAWNGTSWQQLPGLFQGRGIACLASDGGGGLLLFGGRAGIGALGPFPADTLRFAQGAWTTLPGPNPPARAYAAMVTTPLGVLLFGGTGGTTVFGDTWLWNGAWTQLQPTTSPPARYHHAMAFDSGRNVIVLFGGSAHGASQPTADTWEFDGTTWLQRTSAHVPPRRESASLQYVPARQHCVLVGGTTWVGSVIEPSTWAWDGADWLAIAPSGTAPLRYRAGAAFDAARQRVVLFGGQDGSWAVHDDTFEYVDSPASFTSFGTGCPGPNGLVPALAGVPAEPPRLGAVARFRLTSLPTTLVAPVFVLGTSDTVDPGPPPYALPFDLAPLGWPGCRQLVSNEAATLAATVSGQADHTIAVPATTGLLGFTFYAQAIVFYVPTGVAVSNAVRAVVGT